MSLTDTNPLAPRVAELEQTIAELRDQLYHQRSEAIRLDEEVSGLREQNQTLRKKLTAATFKLGVYEGIAAMRGEDWGQAKPP